MMTVVPIGGNTTPALLLGWASAVCLGDVLWDVALACAVAVEDARLVFDRPAADDSTLYPSDHIGIAARLRVESEA